MEETVVHRKEGRSVRSDGGWLGVQFHIKIIVVIVLKGSGLALGGVEGNQREMGLIQEHPRIRVTPRRLQMSAVPRLFFMKTRVLLAVGYPESPSAGGLPYHQWQREQRGGYTVPCRSQGGGEANRNQGDRHGRDEDDRTSLPERAGTGLWPVRCSVTGASRLGMPGVGGRGG